MTRSVVPHLRRRESGVVHSMDTGGCTVATDHGVSMDVERLLRLHEADIVDFAAKLIAVPSENPPGDERAIASAIARESASLGLPAPVVVAREPHRPNLLFRIDCGRPGPCLMYNGHMDTKPVGDRSKWQTDPFEPVVRDGMLYGLGAADMKGGVAALLYAATAIARVSDRLCGSLLLVLSADEEAGGAYGAEYLAAGGHVHADIGLIAEPAGIRGDWEYLNIMSRGEACFRVKVRGTQMHSSISDIVPSVNANMKMAEIMLRMKDELRFSHEANPLCPQGVTAGFAVMARGGVFYGILPGYAEFATDVRTLPGMSQEQIRYDIEAFLAKLRDEDPCLEVDFEFEPLPLGWIEPVVVSEKHAFVKALANTSEKVLGRTPKMGAFPAWTDARFFQHEAGIPTIPAFGPGVLTVTHAPNERVSVRSLIEASRIYALAATRYLSQSDLNVDKEEC